MCLQVVAQSQHNMSIVPGATSSNTNVPSGTCLGDQCGLFSALSLDDKKMKMNGMQSELELNKQQAPNSNSSIEKRFQNQTGLFAFVLVAHGYVVLACLHFQ